MKNSIKAAALFLVLSAGILTATSTQAATRVVTSNAGEITFSPSESLTTVNIKVEKVAPGKAIVVITDADGNILRKDVAAASKAFEKSYILNQLDNGDYGIEVIANNQVVKKTVHVYEEDGVKMFFFLV